MGGSRTAAAGLGRVTESAARRRVGGSPGIGYARIDRQFTRLAVLLTVAVMFCIFGLPLLFSLYLSFQGWDAAQSLLGGRFAGLANYDNLLTDPQFIGSLGITFAYTAATVTAELAIGLAIALLLNVDHPHWDFDDPHLAFRSQMTEPEKQSRFRNNALDVYTFRDGS